MSHHRERIATSDAPAALGPYSQGIAAKGMVFVSGQLGIDPKTGKIVEGGIGAQTRRSLENIGAILKEAGCGFDDIVACTVFLRDLKEFPAMNEMYGSFFSGTAPSRALAEVSRLPLDAAVEISCIAVKV
ncbi:MAG: RidA family protein [Bacteroidota bacterium]|nr:RidA family protein [Bacteroidota bacterium]